MSELHFFPSLGYGNPLRMRSASDSTSRLPLLLISIFADWTSGIQIGRVLPLLARSIMKAVLPDIPHEHADYNVVQNNGRCLLPSNFFSR